MAETITAGSADKVCSLMRQRDLSSGEAADWRTTPGFRYAIAYDLILNGKVYKTIYKIFGEGLPGANYSNATPGSTYLETNLGHEYRFLEDDEGNKIWALTANLILQSEGDTSIGNIDTHPFGQLVVDSDNGDLYIKTNAAAGVGAGSNELVGGQS